MKYWQLLWFIVRNFKLTAQVALDDLLFELYTRSGRDELKVTNAKLIKVQTAALCDFIYNPSAERIEWYQKVLNMKNVGLAKVLPNGDIVVKGPFGLQEFGRVIDGEGTPTPSDGKTVLPGSEKDVWVFAGNSHSSLFNKSTPS